MHGRMLKRRGATLIELVIAIAVAAIALSALMLFMSGSVGRSGDPMVQEQAGAIARAYLEEILQKNFCDPDFDVDGNPATPLDCPLQCTASAWQAGGCRHSGSALEPRRDLYDDVCDYDGLSDSGAVDQTGTAVPGLSQYHVAVDIVDDDGADLNGLQGGSGQVVRIDVEVTHPAMPEGVRLSGFRANY
jgi:MSHA pilin protein MshD